MGWLTLFRIACDPVLFSTSNVARCPIFIRVVVFSPRSSAPHHVFSIIAVIVVKAAIVEDASDARLGAVHEWEDATRGTRGDGALQTSVILE